MAVQGSLMEATKTKAKLPKRYKVVMYNDDFTPMDFVVEVLRDIFHKEEQEAVTLMLAVHQGGFAVVGIYTYDIANTKVKQATERAREEGYPFRLQAEEV